MTTLAWGSRVSPQFRSAVTTIGQGLQIDPSYLMACMAFESGHTFSPSVRNAAGSGAVGLIQFMPQTAGALGTSTAALAAMTAENQLMYVDKYFRPYKGRLKNLGDVYCAILWPAAIGDADSTVIFDKADAHHPKLYLQNRGLDLNANGQVTRQEITARVYSELSAGYRAPNVWTDTPAISPHPAVSTETKR